MLTRRALLAGGAGLAVAACARRAAATPALWRAEGAGRVWLFGAMHALPDDDWVSGPLEAAMVDADELVLEVADTADPAAAFAARTMRPDLPPLAERLPVELRPVLAQLELPPRNDEASWAAALTIGGAAVAQAGARREFGTEAVLARAFRETDKPVRALETPAAQLALFASLPEAQQRVMLARAVADAGAQGRYEALVAAWRAGDVATLEARLNGGVRGVPALYETLVMDRNRRFAAWVAMRLRRPGAALVAVGVGHLLGGEGVPALLKGAGTEVTRVQ